MSSSPRRRHAPISRVLALAGGLWLGAVGCGGAGGGHPEGWTSLPPEPADLGVLEASVARRIQASLEDVRAEPESADRWGELGMLYEVVQLRDQAIECYHQAELRDPSEPRWPYHRGVCRSRMDDVAGAETDLARAQSLAPDYAPVPYRRGSLALELGELDRARALFEQARRIDPDYLGGWIGEAHVLLLEDRADEAVRLLEAQAERAPEDFQVLQLLNNAYRQSGSSKRVAIPESSTEEGTGTLWSDPWQEELKRFRRATKSNRMARMIDAGKSETVIAQLERRREQEPEETSFLPHLAEAYFDVGRVPEARATYRRLIELEPKNIPGRMALARLQVETESPHLALPWLDQVLELDPAYGPAWAMKGTILAAGTRFAESEPVLERAIELDQRDPVLFLWLAKAEAAQRKWDEAAAHLGTYFERGGKDADAFVVRARVEAKRGDVAAARRSLAAAQAAGFARRGELEEVGRLIERVEKRAAKRARGTGAREES